MGILWFGRAASLEDLKEKDLKKKKDARPGAVGFVHVYVHDDAY